MYHVYEPYPYPPHPSTPMYDSYNMYHDYRACPYPYWSYPPTHYPSHPKPHIKLRDHGPEPYVVNIEEATKQNDYYRIALWTGEYLQLTLMSINPGDDIGLEIHEDHDQFIRIEEGQGIVKMGDKRDQLDFQARVYDDLLVSEAIFSIV